MVQEPGINFKPDWRMKCLLWKKDLEADLLKTGNLQNPSLKMNILLSLWTPKRFVLILYFIFY